MKVLTTNKDELSTYITKVIDAGDTLSIKFADGTIFEGYEKTEENFKIIADAMESQVEIGIENLRKFKNKVALCGMEAATVTVGVPIAVALNPSLQTEENLVLAGAAVIVGAGFGIVNLLRNSAKVKEIEKFQYRNEMCEDLENIEQYPHALNGLRRRVAELVDRLENPFSAINSEQFTTKDLQKISQNIEREKVYQLKPATFFTNKHQ